MLLSKLSEMVASTLMGEHAGTPVSDQAGNVLSLPYMVPFLTDIEHGVQTKVDNFKGKLKELLSSIHGAAASQQPQLSPPVHVC